MNSREKTLRAADIVKSSLERTGEELDSFLEQACASDAEIRAEVDSLLKFQAQGDRFIEPGALNLAAEALARDSSLPGDQVIGDYKILSRIGAGGMGDVYLAEDLQFQRKVALKLVRAALSTDDIVTRFRHEEQILASLNDPNIAHLYGGGVTSNGIPFFVMEYVEGLRIDEYCQRHDLSTAARLGLFRKVCSAVHYAHQHLVIHRDLKPSNILVTEVGEPKLLDFGIAKLLKAEDSTPAVTLAGVMTPDYASPEQVRGDAITTASDVYSLGVIFYELLTGHSPYHVKTRSQGEIARAITEQEPERPSTSITKNASPNPQSKIQNLKYLKGDLDNIALMALRKDPARRYQSVGQFSADIQRHLDGLPVLARKDTFTYRASKFVARNKVAVTASVMVLLAIIAGLVVAIWQGQNARRQRDVAQHERVKAERINEFLQRMLSFSNQSVDSVSPVAQKKDVTVNAMLDQITPQVEIELADQPDVRAKILHTIGSAYASQGQYDSAEKNLRAALETQRALYGEDNAEVAATSIELGVLYMRQMKLAEASRLLERALAFNQKQEQTHSAQFSAMKLAQSLEGLAAVRFLQGDVNSAKALLTQALQIASSANLQASQRSVLASIKTDLGTVLVALGDIEKGEPLLRESLALYRQISSQPRWEMGATLTALGMVAWSRNQIDEAMKFLIEGEQTYRQTLGENNSYLAGNLEQQAGVLLRKNDLPGAERKARNALAIVQELSLGNKILLVEPMWLLGNILTKAGQAREAEDFLRQALAIVSESEPRKLFATVTGLRISLSECLVAQNRLPEAEEVALKAYTEAKSILGEKDTLVNRTSANLSKIYQAEGKSEAAEKLK
jgi:serine/threonine-protein kinase